jgi:hypothetical protein
MCPYDSFDSLDIGRSFDNAAVLVYIHSRVVLRRIISHYGGVSVHCSRSQIPTVKAMAIIVDTLPPRPKCGCDGGYDVAVKGSSVVLGG